MRIAMFAAALLVAGGAPLLAQQPGVDALHYRFALTLPDSGPHLDVAATVRFARRAGVDTLRLDLLAPMRVTGATVGCASAADAPVTHNGRVVRIALPRAAAADTLCATVRYAGAPPDGLVISTDSAGRWQAFGDNWPDRGRHWLASIDHPSDKATVEWVVDAPADRRVVANGTLRAQEYLPGRRRRTTWATLAPIPTYLMVIAAAPLVAHDLGQTACGLASVERCVPQQVFTAPEQARFMPGRFAEADAIVRFFSRLVGPFPYEELKHLQSSTRFGGMENAGAIFYADRLFRTPDGVGVQLIAHETAHQWFGNAVTEREWGHLWLSEGFATYFAALYTEHARGAAAFAEDLRGMRDEVTSAKVVAERPVLDTAQTVLLELLNANSYPKGGFVLHMLRREVGDSAFFRGIRAYWTPRVHGTALTDDLRAVMEREAGRDLRWFFDQWLRRPGFAELEVRWTQQGEGGPLAVTVTQGARFAPYRFPLWLEVEDGAGARALVRVEVPAARATTVTTRERFAGRVRAVTVDPRADLLATIRTP